tara:strand:+ start:1837 stop:2730 length:894 start_codon:yes stop_codon:yes gene_type:complete
MKKFLFFLFKVFLLVFVFLIIFGNFQNYVFRNGSYNKVQWINSKENNSYEVVFIGNSRSALFGLNDNSIDYINLADDGSGLKTTYLQLYLFFKNNNKTKQVLWDVDVYSLNNRFSDNKRSPRWLPFFNDSIIYSTLKNDHSAFKFYRILPALSYSAFKFDWNQAALMNNLFDLKESNFGNYGFNNSCESFEHRSDVVKGISNYDSLQPKWVWVDKIHNLCKENNSTLKLFTSPYHTMLDSASSNVIFNSELNKRKLRLVDHSRIYLNIDEYFADYRHLNCNGVKNYVELLKKDVIFN